MLFAPLVMKDDGQAGVGFGAEEREKPRECLACAGDLCNQLLTAAITAAYLPVIRPRRQRASKSGFCMLGLLDYRGRPRRRLHSPRVDRMKVKPPSPPSAQSVQTKKKPPVDFAISP